MELERNSSGLKRTLSNYNFQLHRANAPTPLKVSFPAAYFCAPQFYYTDQPRFETNPRQLQTCLTGRVTFPIPMELPAFTPEQKRYSATLREAVKIGDLFVTPEDFTALVRQATSGNFRAGTKEARKAKPLYHKDNVTKPAEAFERFDSKYNRSFSRRAADMSRVLSHDVQSSMRLDSFQASPRQSSLAQGR